MKKVALCLLTMAFIVPAYAIQDNSELQKAEIKYQKKIEKIKRKQEIKCLKHPDMCMQSAVQQTNMTMGVAQQNVKLGTSQADVALALGSPNIATVDSDGVETWIYDKVSSIASYNNSGFSVNAGGFGGGGGIAGNGLGGGGGLLGAGWGKNSGGVQTNQKTLTIVIKFADKKVSSFKYHMSSF